MKPTRTRASVAATLLAMSLTGCGGITGILSSGTDGEVDVFSLDVGDCLMVDEGSGAVSTSPRVPCEEPHEDEVFRLVETTLDDYPGTEEMFEHAHNLCEPHFEDYVGRDYWDSDFFIWAYTPTESSWESGDREVICILSTPDEPLVGSMKGSGR